MPVNEIKGQKEQMNIKFGDLTRTQLEFSEKGDINMFSKHPPRLAAARIVGQTVFASFMTVFMAANGAAQSQQSVPDVTALSMEDLDEYSGDFRLEAHTEGR